MHNIMSSLCKTSIKFQKINKIKLIVQLFLASIIICSATLHAANRLRDMVQTLGNMVQTLHDTLVSSYNYTDFGMMIHHHSFWKTAHLFKQMTQTQRRVPTNGFINSSVGIILMF